MQPAWAASLYQERPEALQEASPKAGERGIRAGTADVDGPGVVVMSISLERVAEKYLVAKKLSEGTRKECRSTVTKWLSWGQGVEVDQIERQHIRDFLDWVHEKATQDGGANAGRTANKARENLRAFMSWAWEQDYLEKLPRFPKPKPQRDVAVHRFVMHRFRGDPNFQES